MKGTFSAKLNARVRPSNILVKARTSATFRDNLRNILQHGLDVNANVTYAVLITVKTK